MKKLLLEAYFSCHVSAPKNVREAKLTETMNNLTFITRSKLPKIKIKDPTTNLLTISVHSLFDEYSGSYSGYMD